MDYEITSDIHALSFYRENWNGLFDSGRTEVSTSFEWTDALLQTHLNPTDNFRLVIIKNHGEILAFAPLLINRKKKYRLSIKSIFPVSERYSTNSDILLKTYSPELLETFLTALLSLRKTWDVFLMGRITEKKPLLAGFEQVLHKMSMQYLIKTVSPSFFLTLDSSYDNYLKKRSAKFRNHLRRMEKKLKGLGEFSYAFHTDYDSPLAAYTDLLKIEKKSWKHEHGTAIISIKNQEEFYRLFCEGASTEGRLHLLFLFLDDEPIAYNLGAIHDNKYSYLKTSFSDKYRQVGPSTILRAKLVEELIKSGVKYFEFSGGEPYEWERQWTDELQRQKSLLIFNQTCKAKLYFLYNTFRNRTMSHKPTDEIRYFDPKDHKPQHD